MISRETIKLIVAVALGCLLLWGVQTVLDWRDASIENEQRGRREVATDGIIKDGDRSSQARNEADSGMVAARETFNERLAEGNTHEPETATRSARSVPDSRLRAFRERREAREEFARSRLDSAGVQRSPRPRATDPAER